MKSYQNQPILPIIQILNNDQRSYFKNQFNPIYFEPPHIAQDEIFLFINFATVPNIIPERYLISNYGRVYDTYRNIFMGPNVAKYYYQITLAYYTYYNQLDQINILLHRAVMMTFNYIPGCEFLEVNHKDGNHFNNHISNLEWVTHQENMIHAKVNKLMASGEKAGKTNLTNEVAEIICKRLENGESIKSISDDMNICYDIIKNIKYGGSFRYISKDYNFPESDHHEDKFTDEEVITICKRLENGESIKSISDDMRLSYDRIKSIKYGKTYSNITKNFNLPERKEYNNKLDEKVVRKICKRLEKGKTPTQISKELKIPYTIIDSIHKRVTFNHISKDYKFPERFINNRLTVNQVHEICRLLQNGNSCKEISNELNISFHVIHKIYQRKHFIEIVNLYNW